MVQASQDSNKMYTEPSVGNIPAIDAEASENAPSDGEAEKQTSHMDKPQTEKSSKGAITKEPEIGDGITYVYFFLID